MRQSAFFRWSLLASLGLLATSALFADVTLRYKTEVTLNPNLPPQMSQQTMKGLETGVPKESSLQFRNGKGYSSSGAITSICDFTSQQMTLLDPQGKRYATVKFDRFADELTGVMPEMPEQAEAAMAAMKSHIETKLTGRTATIKGIEGEEHEITMSIDAPPNMPAGNGPMIRMVMHFWMAKASEAMRVPAIREVAGYNTFAAATMNPAASMQKMFQQMPGMDFSAVVKELQSNGTMVLLRSQVEMFMPMMALIAKQMGGADIDPNTPLMQMNQELVDISTATLPDTIFETPAGYQSVPTADLFRSMIQKSQGAGK